MIYFDNGAEKFVQQMQNLLFIGVTAHVDIQNNGTKVVNTSIHYISVNCMTALTIRQNGMFVPLVFLYSLFSDRTHGEGI